MSNVRSLMPVLRYILPALIIASFVRPAHATESEALAARFVHLLRYEEQFAKYREQCVATYRTVAPEALVAKNPEFFGGIRPGHNKWQALTSAYEAYFQEACSRPSKSEFLRVISNSYATALSVKQLEASIAFYSSSTGHALVTAHKQASGSVYEAWTTINGKHLAEATARFQREVARMVQSK